MQILALNVLSDVLFKPYILVQGFQPLIESNLTKFREISIEIRPKSSSSLIKNVALN